MTPAHLNHSFIDLFLYALKETGSFTKSLHASLKSAVPTESQIKLKNDIAPEIMATDAD